MQCIPYSAVGSLVWKVILLVLSSVVTGFWWAVRLLGRGCVSQENIVSVSK